MTTKLNHEAFLRLLSSSNVASNESHHRNKCYDTIQYQFSTFSKSESDKILSMRDAECNQIPLKKAIFYLKDSKMFNPGIFNPLMQLKAKYFDLLKSDYIHHNNHSTTFADILVKNFTRFK